ncbi:MAG: InlB B-repeat-containing protein [Christensenellaceae bacterium]
MQKRVVYNFNAQTATESAAENSTDKAVKTSNATGKIKRAFSGKSFKLVVLIVLLFASLFCTICSADWMISQQKVVPNVAGNSIFKFDDLGFGAHVNNGKPTGNYTFNGSSISISMSAAAVGGVQTLPGSAIDAQNIRYRVKKCASDSKPENLNEEFFNSDYTTDLPTDAGTYAVLITSEAGGVSYGKTIKVFTIAPCPVEIEWSGANDFTYDGTDHRSNITATAKTENGAAVNFNISFSYKAHGATTFTPVTEVKNAGTYTATATISNDNYTISSNEAATFTIGQRQVTVSGWGNTSFTYNGKAQKPEPSFNNVVNGDNLNATVTIIGNKQPINEGNYTATVTISNDNYKLSGSPSTPFTIRPLKIAFNGIIESDYADGGIALNKELFKGKFKIAETIADASSVDLSTVHNDIIGGTAKNFSDNEDTSKPENGFYSYAFGKNITAGSTYLISNITLDSTSNFELTTKSVYLKYKTAKIGDVYYTIEDALAQSGTITLCGDATSDSSYVMTAFSKLSLSAGNGDKFKDYKSDYKYTLSGKKLIATFNDSTKEEDVNSSYKVAGNVFSALVISKGVTITLSSSASMIAAAEVGFDYSICTTLAKNHGVIMNNGNIVVNSGCSVTAYGYIKGNGLIQMNSGATALDALTIYDWPGGDAAKDMYKTAFPTNAYTVHNISCHTKVFSGAIYKARVYLNAVSGTIGLNETIVIIGTQNNKGMFNADSDSLASDYILKSVITNQKDIETTKNINSNIALSNQRATGTVTTLNHRDNIEIYGKYSDAPTEISKTVFLITIALKTSTSIPLPVGFMDITVRNKSTLTLNSSDYLILPGAKLTVDNGGKLTLGNNVDLVALPYASAPTTGNYRYTRFYTANTDGNGKKDGKLIVNGTLSGSGYSLGGNISTEQAGATLNIVNASGSYVTMRGGSKPYYETGTVNASGDIMTSQNSYAQRNLSTGTYYSKKVNGKFVWYSQTATITFKANDKTHSTISRTVGANGYTISAADFPTTPPTKDYYAFDKWYIDEALTKEATGQTIFISCALYAGWTANRYSITYKYKYNGGEYENVDNSAYNKTIYTYEDSFFLAPAFSKDGYKFYRWYSDEACTEPITQISGMGENITLYGEFIDADVEVYVVTYVNSNNEVDTPSAENVKSTEAANFKPADLGKITNDDTSKSKYFLGWYIDELCKTLFTGPLTGSVTLYAGWDNKAELSIVIPNSTPILEAGVPTGKYYYKGQSVVIPDISTHPQISAMYTVPEGYKFIGFLATAGCTTTLEHATDSLGYITGITTKVTVSNDLSKGLTITADIRKILKVDITIEASAKPAITKKDFEINKITVSANSFYSKTNSDDWLISDGSTDIKQLTTGTQTFYLLEGSTDITVTINTLSFPFGVKRDAKAPETTGCLTNDSKSPFTFTIKENNATIKWKGQQS